MSNIAIDWSKYMQGLQGKANIALDNISGGRDAVIEYKVNPDGSWYRKYKSGWLEQGGRVYTKVNATITVSLIYPLANNVYQVFTTPEHVAQDIWGYGQTIPSKTNTSFELYIHSSAGSYNTMWYACGRGA